MSRPGGIVLGIQGSQSPEFGGRGIGRYVAEHCSALLRAAGPRIVQLDLDPSLPPPARDGRLDGANLSSQNPQGLDAPIDVYHVMAPFVSGPLERIYPLWARAPRTSLVVTVYDLIPLVMSDVYLRDPRVAAWYRTRLGLIRQADAILAISAATATDVVRLLGVASRRVFNIAAGCSSSFERGDRTAAWSVLRREGLGHIQSGFILYTGGDDYRKNLARLVGAYALLPLRLREDHPLVITCALSEGSRAALGDRARSLGVAGQVVLTGRVSEAALAALYQACGLFVFPSLYEGFGLPVLEAIRSGAVAIASDTSSLPEIVPERDGRFDPSSAESIARTMERALTDSLLRQRLLTTSSAATRDCTWSKVAERTLEAYESLRPPVRRSPRPRSIRVALFTPMPPLVTGIADYSSRLLEELSRLCAVDVFVDGDPAQYRRPRGDVELIDAKMFPWVRAHRGYARVLYVMGNSSFHGYVRRALLECPGDVHAHDIRLTNQYAEIAQRETVDLSKLGGLDDPYMFREVARYAHRLFVHSRFAKGIAVAQGAGDVVVLPFGYPDVLPEPPRGDSPVISTFGMVTRWKHSELLIRAFARVREHLPQARLVFAGRIGGVDEGPIRREVAQLGLGEHVTFTGELTGDEYRQRLGEATVAVQLRLFSNGEMSAAVADCFAAGLPTLVTAVGGFAEIPADAALHMPQELTESELADALRRILCDPGRQRAIGARARQHARDNSFGRVARELFNGLVFRRAADVASAAQSEAEAPAPIGARGKAAS